MRKYRQVPLDQMPHGIAWPIALLDATPEMIATALDIDFERVRDDLDELDGALLELNNGTWFALVYHLNSPVKGMEIVISETSLAPSWELQLIFEAIGTKYTLLWRAPGL